MPNPTVSTRHALIAELIRLEPSLANASLQGLPDCAIELDTPITYCIANDAHLRAMTARVLGRLNRDCGADAKLLTVLFHNLTSEKTSAGYLSQLQGYDWLLAEGVKFAPETDTADNLRGVNIALDGRIDTPAGPVYFDIKSIGFEPELRAILSSRLEEALPGHIISIDGPADHSVDAIREKTFGHLRQLIAMLQTNTLADIPELGWTIRKSLRKPGVYASEASYSPTAFAQANRDAPLRFASQFTTNSAYVLMFVPPDGIGSSPYKRNIFGLGESLMTGIAEHLFGAARHDQSRADFFDCSLAQTITVANAVEMLSGIAMISPQAKLAELHLNGKARFPWSRRDASNIGEGWNVHLHP